MVQNAATGFELTGGCQCGKIRYRARIKTHDAYYCHCRMCQRAFGNIFATFFNLSKANVTWEGQAPTHYASSRIARRGFCGLCGTPLSFEYVDGEHMDLAVGSLDNPSLMRPTQHSGVESRIATFHREDGLPVERTEDVESIMKRWRAAYGDDTQAQIPRC